MLDPQLISQLPRLALPEELGDVLTADIYLYRAPDPLPQILLLPFDYTFPPAFQLTADWHFSSYGVEPGASYRLRVDRPSLSLPDPLWYHLVVTSMYPGPIRTDYHLKMGGGASGPSADAQTLRELLASFRSFPGSDWEFATASALLKEVKALVDEINARDDASASTPGVTP